MTPYDQLKKKIQEAVPSIMALEFGCWVEFRNGTKDIFIEKAFTNHFIGGEQIGFYFVHNAPRTQQDMKFIKILGRPIRLADVLVAIPHWVSVDNDGSFRKGNQLSSSFLGQWNLLDDNLDHQSEETKQFLISLL